MNLNECTHLFITIMDNYIVLYGKIVYFQAVEIVHIVMKMQFKIQLHHDRW